MLEHGASDQEKTAKGSNVAMLAAECGALETLSYFAERCPKLLEHVNTENYNCVTRAAIGGSLECCMSARQGICSEGEKCDKSL